MLHKKSSPANNHVIQSWTLADTAALDALVPVAGDEGRIAFVSSGPVFYVLTVVSPPTWRLLLTGDYPSV